MLPKQAELAKEDIIAFFDEHAPHWDAEMVRKEDIISRILDNAKVHAGKDVLDVACGTGVLISDYLKRQVASVTAIDISPEMAKIAAKKFPQDNVSVLCADVETASFDKRFDCIVVYNAFPHFPDPEHLVEVLSKLLKPGGTLTVAHGMSRKQLDRHHSGRASKVSVGLMSEEDLAAIFARFLHVTEKISNEEMYQVVGCR